MISQDMCNIHTDKGRIPEANNSEIGTSNMVKHTCSMFARKEEGSSTWTTEKLIVPKLIAYYTSAINYKTAFTAIGVGI